MVNGILIDTVEDTRRREMAIPSGFRSGLASAIILRKEDALFVVSWTDEGRKRVSHERFTSDDLDGAAPCCCLLLEASVSRYLHPRTCRKGEELNGVFPETR